MIWISYSLLAAMLWAIVNVIDRYTMVKLVREPLIPLLLLGVVGLLATGIIYCIHGLATFTFSDLILALLTGTFYVLTMFFYFHALKQEEVSKVIPVFYLTPVFILLIARGVLNETLSNQQYWGIAFLVSGAVLISSPSSLKLGISKGIGYILLAAFCLALNQVLTKYLLKNNEFWSVFAYVRVGIFISLLPFFCWHPANSMANYRKISYRAYAIMLLNQLLNLGGVFAITWAMTKGYVSLVNALASVQPFFVLILTLAIGLFWPNLLKESSTSSILIKKFIAIGLMFIGAFLVR
jgi:drug/metabolite transporter (DMT)-like permease